MPDPTPPPTPPTPLSPAELAGGLIGESGVVYSGSPRDGHTQGFLTSLQVLEEWAADLRGDRAAKMYREIRDNEAAVGAAISAMILFSSRAKWRVKPADKTQAAKDVAVFVQQCMGDLGMPGQIMVPSWRDVLVGCLSCIQYGYSISEVVYKRRVRGASAYNDGRWGWSQIQNLGQQSLSGWLFDGRGNLDGVEQQPPNGLASGGYIQIRGALRLLLVRAPGAHNPSNPEGRSLLRSIVVPYLYKKGLQKIQAQGAQRNLVGLPVFNVPLEYLSPTAPPAQQALVSKIKQLGENLDADRIRFLLFPAEEKDNGTKTGFKFSLQSGGQQRPMDLEPTISRYGREMLMGLLADWLMLGSAAGSYALSDDKTGMWASALEGLLDVVAEAFNVQLLPNLLRINGIPPELWPTLGHGGIAKRDRAALAKAVADLMTAGALTKDGPTEDALREVMGLPAKTAGADNGDGGEV